MRGRRQFSGASDWLLRSGGAASCRSSARTFALRQILYIRRLTSLTPFHSCWLQWRYVTNGVGHEAARDPRHNETRSTLTRNEMELTMSTNLQLSLRQLVPIDCRRPLSRGRSHLSFFFCTFYFLARRLGSLPVKIFTPRARDCQTNRMSIGCRMYFH